MALLIQSAGVTKRVVVRNAVHRPGAVLVKDPSSQRVFVRVSGARFPTLGSSTPVKLLPQSMKLFWGYDRIKTCCALGDAFVWIADYLGLPVSPVIAFTQFAWPQRCLTPLVSHRPLAVGNDGLHQRMTGDA